MQIFQKYHRSKMLITTLKSLRDPCMMPLYNLFNEIY